MNDQQVQAAWNVAMGRSGLQERGEAYLILAREASLLGDDTLAWDYQRRGERLLERASE